MAQQLQTICCCSIFATKKKLRAPFALASKSQKLPYFWRSTIPEFQVRLPAAFDGFERICFWSGTARNGTERRGEGRRGALRRRTICRFACRGTSGIAETIGSVNSDFWQILVVWLPLRGIQRHCGKALVVQILKLSDKRWKPPHIVKELCQGLYQLQAFVLKYPLFSVLKDFFLLIINSIHTRLRFSAKRLCLYSYFQNCLPRSGQQITKNIIFTSRRR